MGVQDDAERFEPATIEEWSAWLAAHHADTPGVWLVTLKASSGRRTFDYEEAIAEALRYGWVDSTQRTVDDERTMMWYAPRRPGSVWTRNNKNRVARLEDEGRMEPAGAAAVAEARASGMWTLMDDVEDLVVPEDLAEAFARNDGSRAHWDRFPPSARKEMLAWIALAKRAETRSRRVEETARRAALGERSR
ncbi:YdeI/OmpD-associated family protein [Nocardioides sp.]|uniref:YdeI/OmpD-associated family protein n=1 Tax=Nocardioides sp. TaxID=35761 RepID=UPI002ED4DC05